MEDAINPISIDRLVKYVFAELPAAEQEAVEAIVLKNAYYLELVQNISDYCDQHKVYNSKALNQIIEQDELTFFDTFKVDEPDSPKSTLIHTRNNHKWWWLPLFALILTLIALFSNFFNNNEQPLTPNQKDTRMEETLIKEPSGETDGGTTDESDSTPDDNSSDTEPAPIDTSSSNQIIYAYNSIARPYLKPIPINGVVKSSGAEQLYLDGDYLKVIELLNNTVKEMAGSQKEDAMLLLANAYLQEQQYENAIQVLGELDAIKESPRLQRDIYWQMTLAYLLMEDGISARPFLQKLLEGNTPSLKYYKESEALANQIGMK